MMMNTEEPPPGVSFKSGKVGHWVKNNPSPQLLPVDCPTLPRQSRLVSPFHTQQENLTDLLGPAAED